MRTVDLQPTVESSGQQRKGRSGLLRVALVVAIALALAFSIAAGSSNSSYEDRLVDIALRQSSAQGWKGVALESSAVKALLLDYDKELAFKAQLALEKHADDAEDVLTRFGDDLAFQEVVRRYGENAIPVIAYFVNNDVTSIRLSHLATQQSEAAIAAVQRLWRRLGPEQSLADDLHKQEPETYAPNYRGMQAIAMILRDGHLFLGQFVVNADGKAEWLQTERGVAAVKSIFFSGAIELEKKYRSDQAIEPRDVLFAGADVLFFAGAFKAMKFMRSAKEARTLSVVKRTQLLGAPVLRGSLLGRYVAKYGAVAGTAYLVVRHPGLLSGIFVTVGKWWGISAFWAKVVGWGMLLSPLLLPLLSVLMFVLRIAYTMSGIAARGVQWLLKYLRLRTVPAV